MGRGGTGNEIRRMKHDGWGGGGEAGETWRNSSEGCWVKQDGMCVYVMGRGETRKM